MSTSYRNKRIDTIPIFPNNHSVKVHERNFYEVIGNIEKADEINKMLISKDQKLRNNILKNYFDKN